MDLRELYQEVILDHNKSPRNFGELPEATCKADGYNPLCGDRVTVQLIVDANSVIEQVKFQGSGCAISTASASLLTEALHGKTVVQAQELATRFKNLVTEANEPVSGSEELGKLEVFAGVCEFPSRVKCATLAWHTLLSALEEGNENIVSTE